MMADRFEKVKDAPDLLKDRTNNALLNTNNGALDAYKKKRQKSQDLSSSIEEVQNMKQEIAEVKDMLRALLQKIG
jgi:uncharacterized protein YdcH (DUF465 family)